MITVRMVQPAVDEIVDMVTMRDLFVSAVGTVRMRAVELRRAARGICATDRDDVFVDVILVHVVEMAIVQIIDVAVMANRGVPAIRAMLMRMVGVVFLGASGHQQCSSLVLGFVLCAPLPNGNGCDGEQRQDGRNLNLSSTGKVIALPAAQELAVAELAERGERRYQATSWTSAAHPPRGLFQQSCFDVQL